MVSGLIVGDSTSREDLARYARDAGHSVGCVDRSVAVESIWISAPDLVVLLGDAVSDGGIAIRDELMREPASATTPVLAVYRGPERPERGCAHVATVAPALGEARIGRLIAELLLDVVDERNRGVGLRSLTSAALYRVEREVVFSVPAPCGDAGGHADAGDGTGDPRNTAVKPARAGASARAAAPEDALHGGPRPREERPAAEVLHGGGPGGQGRPPGRGQGTPRGACADEPTPGLAERLPSGSQPMVHVEGSAGVYEGVLEPVPEPGAGPGPAWVETRPGNDAVASYEEALVDVFGVGADAVDLAHGPASRRSRSVWLARAFGIAAMVAAAVMILHGLRLQREHGPGGGRVARSTLASPDPG